MKKIIVLKGVSNTGKTTKINIIADWIIRKYNIPNTIGLDVLDFEKNTFGLLTINNLIIGVNSAGDDQMCIEQIDKLSPLCDILICCCRTKGITYQHIYKNYNRNTGWLDTIIPVDEISPANPVNQAIRDARIVDELQTWLIGLEK